ncbi:hypothetical protein Vadar_007734 [Vaccinium darrowii]|uniref:Uncharacterized protein n=1 Tax=Vaccinium darrowii TaxID=229202 RepID=A0ACB7ZI75_9ERIC|nr:hypothetical protein Vadar_007734 [Vaccinium darrowii]
MIPMRFMSKLGNHVILIEGVTIHVRVIDRAILLTLEIFELRSLIKTTTAVGLVVKFNESRSPVMLQLCVGTRCVVIPLNHLDNFPKCLKEFLADPETCFVGVDTFRGVNRLKWNYEIEGASSMEVRELAAKTLKKPDLRVAVGGWGQLAAEVGLSLEESPSSVKIPWESYVFTDEQIKYAIRDVYLSQLIGSKLLARL